MYRTVSQLDAAGSALAAAYPQLCTQFMLPESSVRGRPVRALRLRAGGGNNRRGVLLVGGTHARELMNPDLLIELAVDLVASYRAGTDVVLGGRTWPAADIKLILETLDLYLLPCVNPDGRHFVMTIDGLWRKNLRDNPGTPCDGVDLNRNADLLWGVTEGQTSCDPCSDVYCGPSVFSEPETRNVRHLLDSHGIDSFADVHSYSELVLHPWGHAPTQTTDPTKRFTTLPATACQPIMDPSYAEYMPPRDLMRFESVGDRIVQAIADVRGRQYTREPGLGLYPTTGTLSDYAYARHIQDSTRRRTYGFTLETGPWQGSAAESFHPANPEPVKREAESGLLELIRQSICAIELIGRKLLDRDTEVVALRRVRDELGGTEEGRGWIALFEQLQAPLINIVLEDPELAGRAARLVAAAGAQVTDKGAILAPETTGEAREFMHALAERGPAELRDDLQAVQDRLRAFAGLSTAEIVRSLIELGPSDAFVPGDDGSGGILGENSPFEKSEFQGDRLSQVTVPPELEDDEHRKRWGLGETLEDRGPYMVELNVQHMNGLAGAATAFVNLFKKTLVPEGERAAGPPWHLVKISKTYFRCDMKLDEWKKLIAADEDDAVEQARKEAGQGANQGMDDFTYRSVYRLWPDFPVQASITRSLSTIKADAALRSFDATGENITWAVIDSGIDAGHWQFGSDSDHAVYDPRVRNLHRCFTPVNGQQLDDPDEDVVDGPPLTEEQRQSRLQEHRTHALQDPLGHGTHVAGIIAGRAPKDVEIVVLERRQNIASGDEDENRPKLRSSTRQRVVQSERERERFHGVAPECRLVSLRALDENGAGRSSNIVRALEYIRERLNDNPKLLRVQGVNLSVGYEFDAEMFACGQSPLCTEVNRLVRAGVVVVTAAGNTGYSSLSAGNRITRVGLSNTINDPGNAEDAITVGSTHREAPHTFGISYFSSKGPTGDGRLKPDLVAPGERIISCAAGSGLSKAWGMLESAPATGGDSTAPAQGALSGQGTQEGDGPAAAEDTGPQGRQKRAYYVEDSGTSMAAPHVSGAIAAFLSIRREFIGRPLEVKKTFLNAATPLGRERYFEGHGLVDLMRAIQSI